MNRKQRRAMGRSARPAKSADGPRSDTLLRDLSAVAIERHRAGAFAEAERHYRRILSLYPAHAETHRMLGAALMAQGRGVEAVPYFEQVCALRPDLAAAFEDLARAQGANGNLPAAIAAAACALELGETPQSRALFARCIKDARFTSDDDRIRRLATRALVEAWARPRELTGACISLVKLDRVIADAVKRAETAWPKRLAAEELLANDGASALATDALFCRLLETDPITDIGLEYLLTDLRLTLLTHAEASTEPDDKLLGFFCALSRQCFINDYVYATEALEAERARRLKAQIEAALAGAKRPSLLWPVALAAYRPLHEIAGAPALLDCDWPSAVEALLAQQIAEPAQERQIAAELPALTAIDGEVSRAVAQQYEQNPYPRWQTSAPAGLADGVDDGKSRQSVEVLIAGCGTGLSTIEFARQAPHARLTAIDLSRASLAYAARMARKLGLTNITFAQADIMKLGAIGRQFDYIDASGVLHHLADPWAGFRILLSLLRPGGVMQVGLYSAVARQDVVAARDLIAARGYRAVPDDIRRFREEAIAAADGSLLKSLMRWNDFFTTSECRDLLFHVQEHRIALPQLKAFLVDNGVQFSGFALDAATQSRFAARFPEPAAATDLDRWHQFESEAPSTFAGMYQFFVRRTPPPAAVGA